MYLDFENKLERNLKLSVKISQTNKNKKKELSNVVQKVVLKEDIPSSFPSCSFSTKETRWKIFVKNQVSSVCQNGSHRAPILHFPTPLPVVWFFCSPWESLLVGATCQVAVDTILNHFLSLIQNSEKSFVLTTGKGPAKAYLSQESQPPGHWIGYLLLCQSFTLPRD